ncbi:hypothetical protein I553_5117 [Mycobacterium xenopi 4042]|uniref:Uncharacterized protein n=1 Tax=Mycobacterium xenopi 4042 TaxID=1299334 RepID=X7ZXC7_MYCXE|nr:hypothetical protein I553_5117 [Mycobacterium xenopi 4042]
MSTVAAIAKVSPGRFIGISAAKVNYSQQQLRRQPPNFSSSYP